MKFITAALAVVLGACACTPSPQEPTELEKVCALMAAEDLPFTCEGLEEPEIVYDDLSYIDSDGEEQVTYGLYFMGLIVIHDGLTNKTDNGGPSRNIVEFHETVHYVIDKNGGLPLCTDEAIARVLTSIQYEEWPFNPDWRELYGCEVE